MEQREDYQNDPFEAPHTWEGETEAQDEELEGMVKAVAKGLGGLVGISAIVAFLAIW
jgi:hypothetical protein